MKKSVAQADPPKEASTFKRIKSPPHLLFSNKMAHYFVDWTTPSGLFKEIYYPYKSLMLQIDPLNSSCSLKIKTKLNTPK